MPIAKEQIRQIITDNNLNSVADVYTLLKDDFKDILQELMEAERDVSLAMRRTRRVIWMGGLFQKVSDRLAGGHPIPCSGMHKLGSEEYSPTRTVCREPLLDMSSSLTPFPEPTSCQKAVHFAKRTLGYSQDTGTGIMVAFKGRGEAMPV